MTVAALAVAVAIEEPVLEPPSADPLSVIVLVVSVAVAVSLLTMEVAFGGSLLPRWLAAARDRLLSAGQDPDAFLFPLCPVCRADVHAPAETCPEQKIGDCSACGATVMLDRWGNCAPAQARWRLHQPITNIRSQLSAVAAAAAATAAATATTATTDPTAGTGSYRNWCFHAHTLIMSVPSQEDIWIYYRFYRGVWGESETVPEPLAETVAETDPGETDPETKTEKEDEG